MTLQEYFTDESKWIKGAFYKRDEEEEIIACCLSGAVIKCYLDRIQRNVVLDLICQEICLNNPAVWNDDPKRTFQDILTLVKKLNI